MRKIFIIMLALALLAAAFPGAGAEQAAAVAEQAATGAEQTEAGVEQAAVGAEAPAASGTEDARVEAFLAAQAETQKDAWVRAILTAGVRNVTWEGRTATFFLRGFDPDLKALGAYLKAEDRAE